MAEPTPESPTPAERRRRLFAVVLLLALGPLVGLVLFDIVLSAVLSLFARERLPLWLQLTAAVAVVAWIGVWIQRGFGHPPRLQLASIAYPLILVLGIPLAAARFDRGTAATVPAVRPIPPAAVDMLLLEAPPGLFDRPALALPAPPEDIVRWDVSYAIATADRRGRGSAISRRDRRRGGVGIGRRALRLRASPTISSPPDE